MEVKFDSYKFRCGELKLSSLEAQIMNILMDFGESVDCQGYDDGDYDTAMNKILELKIGE